VVVAVADFADDDARRVIGKNASLDGDAPAAIASVKLAMEPCRRRGTSKTSCATVGMWERLLSALAQQHSQFHRA